MPVTKYEKVGECGDCENGIIVKETLGAAGSTWIEVLTDGQQLPPRTIVLCHCTSCGKSYHLDTIIKLTAKHA